ncbi:hypothetical protein TNIN_343501 [Trichonephila inaurata madagascariensis]|uniref:Uncharacterized protein n=1 Tax=Trichonephila inaurata madagascariensis TaxID=2747483 RepID=A0A8X7CCC6_9ARAC|nr:hypothetical protein TNIN_343501 [Trichonephila inaurata madagascariensis]
MRQTSRRKKAISAGLTEFIFGGLECCSRGDRYTTRVSAEDETYEGKEETPVDVIKDNAKDDLNPVILSKERVDLDDDEIEEEKLKLPKRKLKKLSRMTVAELQQKVNLINIIIIPQHWCFKRKSLQDRRGVEKPSPFKTQ